VRNTLFNLAAVAVALTFAGSASADTPVRTAPVTGSHLTLPPGVHPDWPGYPPYPRPPYYPPPHYPPYYPPPRPRPPAVQIQYTVKYRPGPYAHWRVYGRFSSHASASRAAARLERRGYQTDIVVTYGR
jgi:hypothetical protein